LEVERKSKNKGQRGENFGKELEKGRDSRGWSKSEVKARICLL